MTILSDWKILSSSVRFFVPGKVIRAWDIGVATMKRGELAVLTCRADYAYGPSGSPPKIPPNATLTFEVELFDWKGLKEIIDLLIFSSTGIIPGV